MSVKPFVGLSKDMIDSCGPSVITVLASLSENMDRSVTLAKLSRFRKTISVYEGNNIKSGMQIIYTLRNY